MIFIFSELRHRRDFRNFLRRSKLTKTRHVSLKLKAPNEIGIKTTFVQPVIPRNVLDVIRDKLTLKRNIILSAL